MNRKSDKNNHPIMDDAPTEWYEPTRVVSPSKKGGEEVVIKLKSSEEISKEQLDPSLFNLSEMIVNGTLITPSGDVKSILNSSDIADIQSDAESEISQFMEDNPVNSESNES